MTETRKQIFCSKLSKNVSNHISSAQNEHKHCKTIKNVKNCLNTLKLVDIMTKKQLFDKIRTKLLKITYVVSINNVYEQTTQKPKNRKTAKKVINGSHSLKNAQKD